MWVVLLLLGTSLNYGLCDEDQKVLSLDGVSADELVNALAFHPEHLMQGGVDRNYHNPQEDLHGGHGDTEAELQKQDLQEFLNDHKSRRKVRKHHSRSSKDKLVERRRGRFRRETSSKPIRYTADIVVPKGNIRRKRFFGTWMLWEKGIIPFSFAGGISDAEKKAAEDAIAIIQLYTCVRFVEKDGSADFNQKQGLQHNDSVLFVPEANTGCWSQVGQRGDGQQEASACDSMLTAMHEIGHVMGAFHEHESYDRVGNVEQNVGNILEGMEWNFNTHDPAYKSFFNIDSYDLQSLMHYEPYDFSGNGLPTLDPLYNDFAEPADDYWLLMKETSKVYKCWENKCEGVSLECGHQGYKAYYNNTCQCTCPAGLDPSTQCNGVLSQDCGGVIHLSKEKPSEVIEAPSIDQYTGKDVSCTWLFKSPGKVKLDVTKMTLKGDSSGCQETIQIRRNLLGQSGAIYCGSGFEKSIMSVGSFLAVDLKGGAMMTAELIAAAEALFADESCYNWNDRGETYNGDLDRAENYLKCVNWTEATTCNHSPFFFTGDLKADYSGSSCRNPGGVLHRPWCYTDVRETSCTIRYCEPCQLGNKYDVYDNCEDILSRFPDFCDEDEAQHGCRKTCDMPNPTVVTGKCDSPPAILGATLVVTPLASYEIGDSVTYQCDAAEASRWCLSTGEWSELAGICGDCADKISKCETMLKRNHTMCISTATFSETYCAATCGKCGDSIASCTVSQPVSNSHTKVVTTSTTVPQGDYAQYACAHGYFHESGDFEIVCMSDGTMYGEMPKCSTMNMDKTPLSDLEVIQLKHVFFQYWAFIGQNKYTNITRAGAIKTWYFYCVNQGQIRLVVFRNTDEGTLVVGQTKTWCDADRMNLRHLDSMNEIYVKEGDYIGVLDETGGALTFTTCEDNSIMSYVVTIYQPELLTDGAVMTLTGLQFCAYASVNADIGPVQHSKFRLINYKLKET